MSFKHVGRLKRQNRDIGFVLRVIVEPLICAQAQLSVELGLIF